MNFAVGIIVFQQPAGVRNLLSAISKWKRQPSRIYVVDNSNPPLDLQKEAHGEVEVEFFNLPRNPGFGAAANLIISEARGKNEFLILLSHEVEVSESTALELVQRLETDPKVAVCGPTLAYLSRRDLVFSRGGTISRNARVKHLGRRRKLRLSSSNWQRVDWLDGSCSAMRISAVWNCGGFDENYFLYVEEVDLHIRLSLNGFRVEAAHHLVAFQEPGRYPLYLRYRNHMYLSQKKGLGLKPWPWRFAAVMDLTKTLFRNWRQVVPVCKEIAAGVRDAGTNVGGAPSTSRIAQRK